MTITFSNPEGLHAPLGLYSHSVLVPSGTELLFISGQLGVSPDGSTPGTISEQAEQVFANIIMLLRSHGLEASAIQWSVVKTGRRSEMRGSNILALIGRHPLLCSFRN